MLVEKNLESDRVNSIFSAKIDGSYHLACWFCAAIVILIVVLEPVSHLGLPRTWADQSKFSQALAAALHGGGNALVDAGWVGSGYVGAAVFLHRVVSISPDDTLVLLNRLCYLGTAAIVACFAIFMWRPGEERDGRFRWFALFGTFAYLLCVTQANGLTFFSDVPWTHFVSSFFIVLTMTLVLAVFRIRSAAFKYLALLGAGASIGMLTGVRPFDGIVVALSLLITYGIRVFHAAGRRAALRSYLLAASLMFITASAAFIVSFYASGAQKVPLFYLALNMDPALKKLYPLTFFRKFIQIFVDTSFDTSNHPFVFRNAILKTWQPSFEDWKMPILLQAPIMLYVFLVLPIVVIGNWLVRKNNGRAETACLRALVIVAIALLIGYTTTFVAGAPHLVNGMIRDYMPVIWCLVLVTAPSSAWLWLPRPSHRVPLVLAITCILILLIGEVAAARGQWIADRSQHIADAIVEPKCANGDCTLSVTYVNPNGYKWAERSDLLLATINCAGPPDSIVLKGPSYRFHECAGATDGIIQPRMSGFANVPMQQVPVSFSFQLQQTQASVDDNRRSYRFGLGAASHSMLTSGWSHDETKFVWSNGKQAQLDIPIRPFKDGDKVDIELQVSPFVIGVVPSQRVIVQLADGQTKEFALSKDPELIHLTQVPVVGSAISLKLSLPDAISPAALGLSADPRVLAIGLRRVTISPSHRAQ